MTICSSLEGRCQHRCFPLGETEAGEAKRLAQSRPPPRGRTRASLQRKQEEEKSHPSHPPHSSLPGDAEREPPGLCLGQAIVVLTEGHRKPSRGRVGRVHPRSYGSRTHNGSDCHQGPLAGWAVASCPRPRASAERHRRKPSRPWRAGRAKARRRCWCSFHPCSWGHVFRPPL